MVAYQIPRRKCYKSFLSRDSNCCRILHEDMLVCQQTKYMSNPLAGLLQPLTVPTQVGHDLSMDFITHLPSYKGNTTILLVVDYFSKTAHCGILHPDLHCLLLAELYLDYENKMEQLCKWAPLTIHKLMGQTNVLIRASYNIWEISISECRRERGRFLHWVSGIITLQPIPPRASHHIKLYMP